MTKKSSISSFRRVAVLSAICMAVTVQQQMPALAGKPEGLPASLSDYLPALGAEKAVSHFLQKDLLDEMQPSSNSRFVLLPRVKDDQCDILRIAYKVPHYTIIASSTRWVMLIQIASDSDTSKLLPIPDLERLEENVFKWQGSGPPPPDPFQRNFTVRGPNGDRIPITDPKGDPKAFWFQTPGVLGCYLVNWDNLPNRPTLPSLDLAANEIFFSPAPRKLNNFADWQRYPDGGKQVLLDALVAPAELTQPPLQQSSAVWASKSLSPAYQPPSDLEYVSIPQDRAGKGEASQIRYSVGSQVVTIQHTETLGIVQVEQVPMTWTPTAMLSEEKVEDVVHNVFADSAPAVANSNPGSESEGSIAVSPTSKAAWLNSVKWWQEPGRLVFYWNKTSGHKVAGVP